MRFNQMKSSVVVAGRRLSLCSVVAFTAAATGQPGISAGVDLFNAQSAILNFASMGATIPADFFDPGSAPFGGAVGLAGVPIDPFLFGDADTIIVRPNSAFFSPPFELTTVDIEIVQLSLMSVAPVTITGSGDWILSMDLSDFAPSTGTLDLQLDALGLGGDILGGGLNILPRFTFTRVSNPADVRVFDFGLEGLSPIPGVYPSSPVLPWSISPPPGVLTVPPDPFFGGLGTSNFFPGADPATGQVSGLHLTAPGFDLHYQLAAPVPTPGTLWLAPLAATLMVRRRRSLSR